MSADSELGFGSDRASPLPPTGSFIAIDRYEDNNGNCHRSTESLAAQRATVLEEKIEEEITTTTYPGDEVDGRGDDATGDLQSDYFVELNLSAPPGRVAFPELGVDIIDIDSAHEDAADHAMTEIKLSDLRSWEENWLFQKRRRQQACSVLQFTFTELDLAAGPVRMFIPNPNPSLGDGAHEVSVTTTAKIGDIDVDQLSEFSEHNSSGSTLTFSSEDEDARSATGDGTASDANSRQRAKLATVVASDDEAFFDTRSDTSPTGQTSPHCRVEVRTGDERSPTDSLTRRRLSFMSDSCMCRHSDLQPLSEFIAFELRLS